MSEIWKDIPGYEGLYQVSNLGNVRSVDRYVRYKKGGLKKQRGRVMRHHLIWSGYASICLCKHNIKRYHSVHRLVMKSFKPCTDMENLQVNHINGLRDDNNLKNLEWCSASDNNTHSFRVLRRKPIKYYLGKTGAGNPHSIPIIQKDQNGDIIARFDSSASAARALGLDENSISRACRRERKTAYGYIWERRVI